MKTRIQVVVQPAAKMFVKTALSPKGEKLKAEGVSEEVLLKYTKNYYVINPESKPFKKAKVRSNGQIVMREVHIKHIN
jgi:hypothetical protein